MEPEPPPGPPVTLGEVRWLDAISLLASCKVCAHETVLNVDSLPDTVPLYWFASRFVCKCCDARSAHIFRLAGQRNQTGLIWRIICRDERAVTIAGPARRRRSAICVREPQPDGGRNADGGTAVIRCFLFHRPISCEQRSESPPTTRPQKAQRAARSSCTNSRSVPPKGAVAIMTLLQTNERR